MSLKLSTGFCRGMTLASPPEGTRPTAGKVRAAVWNSLQTRIHEADVLDVFAGSGAVGIEALSRGARQAVFVESGAAALKALKSNLNEVERRAKSQAVAASYKVLGNDAAVALRQCSSGNFDVLWMDPPYAILEEQWNLLWQELLRLARSDAVLVVESDAAGAEFLEAWAVDRPWVLERQKLYGKVAVSFFSVGEQT